MKNRTALILALVSITLGMLFRFQFVENSGFVAEDLARYERTRYGIDLPDHYGGSPYWLAWSRGDGQAYVTLAGDPWADDAVRGLSAGLYRYSRIGYSWAVLVVTFGRVDLIPYGLFGVSMLSLGVIGWIVGRNLHKWGLRSLVLLVVPGALISAASDTAEAFGLALAALAVTAPVPAAMVTALALGVVRPDFATTLFLRGRRSMWLIGACASTAVGIQILGMSLGLRRGGVNNNLTWPFAGYLDVLDTQVPVGRSITIGLLAVSTLTILHGVREERSWRRLAFLSTGGFMLLLAPVVLNDFHNSLRVAASLSLVWAIPAQADRPTDSTQLGPPPEERAVVRESGTPQR